jgi:type VI secretion system protein ImpM
VNGDGELVVSGAAPAWFGKLPGMGDLAHRRMPDAFRDAWDRWLKNGLARLRVRHDDWTERYLKAPLWCFVVGGGVVDGQRWIGVMMPSVDDFGRYFPFTVVAELVSTDTELKGAGLARVRQWWTLAARAALEGLKTDLDAVRFEVLLHRLFAGEPALRLDERGGALALPVIGQSLWFTDPAAEGGLGMASQGLPQDDQFESLFGYLAGAAGQDTEAA